MRKSNDADLLVEDGDPPPDDGTRAAQGANKHRAKSCPFCGATDVHAKPIQVMPELKPDFAVRCSNCDAVGPWGFTAKLAVGLWNDGFKSSRPAADRRTRNEPPPKKQKTKR
jgi:Lar family restriction alleviation protein